MKLFKVKRKQQNNFKLMYEITSRKKKTIFTANLKLMYEIISSKKATMFNIVNKKLNINNLPLAR